MRSKPLGEASDVHMQGCIMLSIIHITHLLRPKPGLYDVQGQVFGTIFSCKNLAYYILLFGRCIPNCCYCYCRVMHCCTISYLYVCIIVVNGGGYKRILSRTRVVAAITFFWNTVTILLLYLRFAQRSKFSQQFYCSVVFSRDFILELLEKKEKEKPH